MSCLYHNELWKETVKAKLLNSLMGNGALEELGINTDNVTYSGEAITIINSYEEII